MCRVDGGRFTVCVHRILSSSGSCHGRGGRGVARRWSERRCAPVRGSRRRTPQGCTEALCPLASLPAFSPPACLRFSPLASLHPCSSYFLRFGDRSDIRRARACALLDVRGFPSPPCPRPCRPRSGYSRRCDGCSVRGSAGRPAQPRAVLTLDTGPDERTPGLQPGRSPHAGSDPGTPQCPPAGGRGRALCHLRRSPAAVAGVLARNVLPRNDGRGGVGMSLPAGGRGGPIRRGGLRDFDLHTWDVPCDLTDMFLYAGMDRPHLCFDDRFRSGISNFREDASEEIPFGLAKLREDLASGRWRSIRAAADRGIGDYCFFVAE